MSATAGGSSSPAANGAAAEPQRARPVARQADGTIDWTAVQARLRELAVLASPTRPPDAERALLAERARRLARVPESPPVLRERLEVLHLRLADRPYAIATARVIAVARDAPRTPLPGATPPVVALVAWRGRLLTTLDLRPLFGLPTPEARWTLLLGRARPQLALVLGSHDGIEDVDAATLQPLASGSAGAALTLGLLPDARVVLDADALLARFVADD